MVNSGVADSLALHRYMLGVTAGIRVCCCEGFAAEEKFVVQIGSEFLAVHEDADHLAHGHNGDRGRRQRLTRGEDPRRVYRHASPSSIEDGKAPQRPRHF